MPDREQILLPRIDTRDHIEIVPDQSDWIARLPIIVENRQGNPPLKALNRALGTPVIEIGSKVFAGGRISQTGGPTPDKDETYHEEFDPFRDKKKFGITSNAGGSFKDSSYVIEYKGVRVKLVINTVTTSGSDGRPIPREDRQRGRMVLNARDHTFIIDVGKPRQNETVDLQAWERFLESRTRYIKGLIDKEFLTDKDNNHRLLVRFKSRVRR